MEAGRLLYLLLLAVVLWDDELQDRRMMNSNSIDLPCMFDHSFSLWWGPGG